jgi:hypothetical protein
MKFYLIYKWNGRANFHSTILIGIETDLEKAKSKFEKLKSENTETTVTFELKEFIQE